MDKTPNTEPDMIRLRDTLIRYDTAQGARSDIDGRKAGVDAYALLGVAMVRARTMFDHFGPLRQALPADRCEDVIREMALMWMDGFTARAWLDQDPDSGR